MSRWSKQATLITTLLVLLLLFLIYYVWADRVTPSTSDAYVEAHVIQVAPRVSGRVEQVAVINNQAVKKGQLLFALNDEVFLHALNRQKALLREAKEQVEQYEAQASGAKAALTKAKADLAYDEKQYKANQSLVAEGAVSELKFQSLKTRYHESQQAVRQAQFQLLNIMKELQQQNGKYAQVQEAQASLNQAQQNYNNAKVYAPFDGRVTFLRVSQGMYAKAATPVLALIDTRHWWVIARIKENNLSRVKPGQPVDISPELYPDVVLKGRVQSIGWGVNLDHQVPPVWLPYIPSTRNWVRLAQRFPVQIALAPDPKYPLRVGATAIVTIYTEPSGFIHWASSLRQRVMAWLQLIY